MEKHLGCDIGEFSIANFFDTDLNEATDNEMTASNMAVLPSPSDSTPGNNGISYPNDQYGAHLP